VIECSTTNADKNLRERIIRIPTQNNFSSLRISQIVNLISEEFEVGNKLRLYNFNGYEIIEDSDLEYLKGNLHFLDFLYFTRINEYFENKNIMRIFKIKEKIGEGGFGKVYLAQQKFTHHNIAIKIFRQSFFSAMNLNHLFKEIEILKKLDHPNIIKLYSNFVLDNDRIVLILEYASGGTLRSKLIFNIIKII